MTDTETVLKTIGIKLNLAKVQEKDELEPLFESFRTGINWSLHEIENRYQKFINQYHPLSEDEKVSGICAECNKEKPLRFTRNGEKYCMTCASRMYSEYTVRKEVYGARERTVVNDLKDIVEIPNKTHYDSLFSQAYTMWKSFNSWRNKRLFELQLVEKELNEYEHNDKLLVDTAHSMRRKEADAKRINPKKNWKEIKRDVHSEVFKDFTDDEQDELKRLYELIGDKNHLSKPIHFPELKECRTVKMNAGFVSWKDEKLYLTLWSKKPQQIDYFGGEYLKQFIPDMEKDNQVYCNLSKKNGKYYLMYPLEIKIEKPKDINECDTFVAMFSPGKAGLFGYDEDGCINFISWFPTGELLFAKRHFKENRTEIARRRSPEEKMRKIKKRKTKIVRMGRIEMRYVSSFNHELTHSMIECLTNQSCNPKILIWDVGNGITQNFGKKLNYLKNLWPAVQQQDYLKHKAMQISIPVVEIKYNKCNDLVCSSCGEKQIQQEQIQQDGNYNGKKKKNKKKNKPMKVITQLIKGIKNFKCQKCGYEVNALINQANNIANL